jgi:hypothetical protein
MNVKAGFPFFVFQNRSEFCLPLSDSFGQLGAQSKLFGALCKSLDVSTAQLFKRLAGV